MFGAVAAILPTGGNEEVQRERTRGTLISSAEPLRTEPMRTAISLQGHSLTRKDQGLGVDNTVGEPVTCSHTGLECIAWGMT